MKKDSFRDSSDISKRRKVAEVGSAMELDEVSGVHIYKCKSEKLNDHVKILQKVAENK